MVFKCSQTIAFASFLLINALLGAEKIDFAREVLPILSDKCFTCHGPDTKKAKDLRLDSYEAATRDRKGIRSIDPDDLENSELIFRIHDDDDPMPPEEDGKALTTEEKEILTRWVKQGGEYASHWAFVAPTKSKDIPREKVIDFFIKRKLATSEPSISLANEA